MLASTSNQVPASILQKRLASKSGWHQHHRIPPSGSTAQIQIALSGEDREQQADLRNGLKTISPRFDNLLQCVIQHSNRQLYGIPMQTEATEHFQ